MLVGVTLLKTTKPRQEVVGPERSKMVSDMGECRRDYMVGRAKTAFEGSNPSLRKQPIISHLAKLATRFERAIGTNAVGTT